MCLLVCNTTGAATNDTAWLQFQHQTPCCSYDPSAALTCRAFVIVAAKDAQMGLLEGVILISPLNACIDA